MAKKKFIFSPQEVSDILLEYLDNQEDNYFYDTNTSVEINFDVNVSGNPNEKPKCELKDITVILVT